MAELRARRMQVIAQDPGVRRNRRILTTTVSVPWEDLQPGPMGHRVCVIDYDASTRRMYKAAIVDDGHAEEPTKGDDLLGDPGFHARNVYALVMRTLARFEYALGRRVGWGFPAHQLKVVPHAFEEMNAFYSRDAEALVFGYYRAGDGVAFTCLSHDVVVHETSHALLDGLRYRFMAPSSPDQAAFHEGFGDVVALLSVFSLGKVLLTLLEHSADDDDGQPPPAGLIARERVSMESLMDSVLLGLAEEMGAESGSARAGALRRSVKIEPDERILDQPEFGQAHRRGEVLVAAMMRTFVDAWTRRLDTLGKIEGDYLDLGRVAEEGATIAEVLLTMAIRAIDYTPPIHIEFGDYLSALLTADGEIRADDGRYGLRQGLLDWFGRYGIEPASGTEDGRWRPPDGPLEYQGVRFQSLQTDPVEMFALLWANRKRLRLHPGAYTRVASVRPCVRTSPDDGLPLRETVAECIQYVRLQARDLGQFGLTAPAGMPANREVTLEGGSTLILDEYGRLKYEIHNRLPRGKRGADERSEAQERLQYLWDQGAFDPGRSLNARLATLHRRRVGLDELEARDEVW
jgi:hypothetical protein